jgi:RND superfamily putative drug exporter
VLAATFAVLGTLPLTFVTQLGIAVALGVLLDTVIVRSVLVTALTLDVGRWMWWPSALAQREDEPGRHAAERAEAVRLPVPRHASDAAISPSTDRSPGPRGP